MSLICLREAFILSGFRGGGSGGSEAAIVVMAVVVPFNCIANYSDDAVCA